MNWLTLPLASCSCTLVSCSPLSSSSPVVSPTTKRPRAPRSWTPSRTWSHRWDTSGFCTLTIEHVAQCQEAVLRHRHYHTVDRFPPFINSCLAPGNKSRTHEVWCRTRSEITPKNVLLIFLFFRSKPWSSVTARRRASTPKRWWSEIWWRWKAETGSLLIWESSLLTAARSVWTEIVVVTVAQHLMGNTSCWQAWFVKYQCASSESFSYKVSFWQNQSWGFRSSQFKRLFLLLMLSSVRSIDQVDQS